MPAKTKPQSPFKNKENFVYYLQPTPRSPDLSHLPLPSNLHLIATVSLSIPMKPQTQSTQVPAFEVSTPAALLHSIHYYFAPHISTNCQDGFRPVFTQISLQHTINIPPQAGNKTQKQLVDTPIQGKLMGKNDYAERFLKDASGKSLKRVVVCVAWRRDDEESPDEDDEDDEDMQEMNARMRSGYGSGVSESFLRQFGSRRDTVVVLEDGEEVDALFRTTDDFLTGGFPRARRMATMGEAMARRTPRPGAIPDAAALMAFGQPLLGGPVGTPPRPGGFF